MENANVFTRLSFDFDPDRFGASNYLPNTTINYLNNNPLRMADWQKTALANSSVIRSDYYRDPTINVVSALWSNVNTYSSNLNTIYSFDGGVIGAQLVNVANQLANNTIVMFQKHTSNISGLTPVYTASASSDFPDYDKATGIGQELLMILNTTDQLANAVPLLGNFTSLFINDDITSNTLNIMSDIITLQNSLYLDTNSNVCSNLSTGILTTLLNRAESANTLLYSRRNHDINFYRNSLSIISDYRQINKLGRVGNTQNYLITNYVGTDNYIEKLQANT
jgi:hypothetical protein